MAARHRVRRFTAGFLWGAATSAHQVEGKLKNDWRAWELANAARLAREATRTFAHLSPVWNEVKAEATDPANYLSGRADDQVHRYPEDIALMRRLNLNAYRFSIDWSRIEPEEGVYSQDGLSYYCSLVDGLRAANIEPMVTLWHWPLPVWLRDRGGWEWPGAPERFKAFTKTVAEALGRNVRLWCTLNEVNVYAGQSYLGAQWPPMKRSLLAHERVTRHLIEAHRRAYRVIHDQVPRSEVGVAHAISDFQAADRTPFTTVTRLLADWWWNRRFLNSIMRELDFVGVNFYSRNVVRGLRLNCNENRRRSDLGWELYPPSMLGALRTAASFSTPLYITENGLADRNDRHRAWFIRETLRYVHQAIEEGVDVRGYFHWSLLDNFEWDKGYWPRFGLIKVDRKSLRRTVRPSARIYAEIARRNGV